MTTVVNLLGHDESIQWTSEDVRLLEACAKTLQSSLGKITLGFFFPEERGEVSCCFFSEHTPDPVFSVHKNKNWYASVDCRGVEVKKATSLSKLLSLSS
jgi:hypothetical protein